MRAVRDGSRRREHRRAIVLAKSTIRRVAASGNRFDVEAVAETARSLYSLAANEGGRMRSAWYRYPGALLANPTRKLASVNV